MAFVLACAKRARPPLGREASFLDSLIKLRGRCSTACSESVEPSTGRASRPRSDVRVQVRMQALGNPLERSGRNRRLLGAGGLGFVSHGRKSARRRLFEGEANLTQVDQSFPAFPVRIHCGIMRKIESRFFRGGTTVFLDCHVKKTEYFC